MELQELTTFVTVAQYNSFSKAAAHLGYSQAAVTIQIKNLESELQIRLFDRLGKSISLTTPGKRFYDYSIQTLNCLHESIDSMKQSDQLTGALRIGTIDSLCSSIFSGLVTQYLHLYPQVSVSITTDTPSQLLDMLHHNEIDMVYLLDAIRTEPWLDKVIEQKEKVIFATAPDHPLADGKFHKIDELLSFPFILTEKDASYRKVLDYQLSTLHKEIQPLIESNNTDFLLDMVRNKFGITFLPEFALLEDIKQGQLKEIYVSALDISVWCQIIHHKDKWITREMKAFFDLCLLS
ncbi:MAG: LysR family transcriptional regulator [Lachnospiraceae bacterium]|nr:LysR family transcriptional regulator [Lachnospiraceae bacterium]